MKALGMLVMMSAAVWCKAETPLVASLHTVSIHVDSPQTYNALLRFFEQDLQWPLIYGKPWSPDRQGRRNYAGLWAGNVVLEICGAYAGETYPEDVRARLHGLTFRAHGSFEESMGRLDKAGISHKLPFGGAQGSSRFLVVDDPALTSATLAVSIMQTAAPDRERVEQERARSDLSTRRGGPLGADRRQGSARRIFGAGLARLSAESNG